MLLNGTAKNGVVLWFPVWYYVVCWAAGIIGTFCTLFRVYMMYSEESDGGLRPGDQMVKQNLSIFL